VIAFTSTGRGECLAYSLDGARTFQEYNGNPVFDHNGRDPKIIWFAQQKKWIIIVYDEPAESEPGYSILESKNLKNWQKTDFLPGWFECPELFELPLENGDPGERLWVLHGCIRDKFRSAYQVGNFDGSKFTPLAPPLLAHGGPNFYAAQIFNQAPGQRRIMLGWLAGADYPGMPFGHGMTVPLELSLRKANDVTRLIINPIKELEKLRIGSESASDMTVDIANKILAGLDHELLEFYIVIGAQQKQPFFIHLRNYQLEYNPKTRTVIFCGTEVPCQPGENQIKLRILMDRSVTEVFVDEGWSAVASITVFDHSKPFYIQGVDVVNELRIHKLKSIWKI
jgi:fructan beta-fructosidase